MHKIAFSQAFAGDVEIRTLEKLAGLEDLYSIGVHKVLPTVRKKATDLFSLLGKPGKAFTRPRGSIVPLRPGEAMLPGIVTKFDNPILNKAHSVVQRGITKAMVEAPAATNWMGTNMPAIRSILDILT